MDPLVGGNLADKAIATGKKFEDLVIYGVDQGTQHGKGPSGGIVDLWRVGRQFVDILSDTARGGCGGLPVAKEDNFRGFCLPQITVRSIGWRDLRTATFGLSPSRQAR